MHNSLNPCAFLEHSDIRVTMRYAHFAPDHLEEALTLNPLTKLATVEEHKVTTHVKKGGVIR
ncbi:hypothetical protein CS371_10180 [Serratia marcescens]|nr:hypothetical protein CS371_10180 [Serratia marcescens]